MRRIECATKVEPARAETAGANAEIVNELKITLLERQEDTRMERVCFCDLSGIFLGNRAVRRRKWRC